MRSDASGRRAPRAVWPLLGGLAAAQIRYGRTPNRSPAATRRLLVAMLAASTGEAMGGRGARQGSLASATAGGIGFGAEILGVSRGVPFGRYAYSERLGPRVAGVPVLAAAAWSILARPAWIAAGWATRSRSARIVLAAWALTAWDVYLDPRMVAEGYWSWERGGAYEGVPASNFLGWWVTALAVFAVTAAREDGVTGPHDDGALALYVWTWLGEAFANAVLWRRPRVAAAGSLAMGVVAVPALRRRLLER
jgi:putative membrane protein